MNVTRTEILMGNYQFPPDLIKLKPTRHFQKQLAVRGMGLDCIPTIVRVTKGNIHSAKTEDGKTFTSVVVGLKYNSKRYLFLAINPIDGALKTLWFQDEQNNRKNSKPAVQDGQAESPMGALPGGWDGGSSNEKG